MQSSEVAASKTLFFTNGVSTEDTSIFSTSMKKIWLFWHLNLRVFLPLQILKLEDRHSPSNFLARSLAFSKIVSILTLIPFSLLKALGRLGILGEVK